MRTLSSPDFWIPLTAMVAGLAAALLFRLITLRHARRRESSVAAALARHTTRPLFLLLPVFLARVVQPLLDLEPAIAPTVRHAATLLLILGFGWLLISLISVLDEYLREQLLSGIRDDRRAKRILTRVGILDRVHTILIVVLTAATMLITFPEARTIGASTLASAGIAGLVLGIAARPAAETLMPACRSRSPSRFTSATWRSRRASGDGSRRSRAATSWCASGTCAAWWFPSATSSRSRFRTGPGRARLCSPR